MDDKTRVVVSSTADTVSVINYSINFYLYCVANDDIRKSAVYIITNSYISQKAIVIVRYMRQKLLSRF